MRYTFLLFFILCYTVSAQTENGWGLTAGLNYSGVGELSSRTEMIRQNPDENIGWHAGVFSKYDLGPISLRVGLTYADISSDYNGEQFDLKKLDLPVLFGINIIGPLEFFIGPAAQYTLAAEIDDIDFRNIEDRATFGAQAGFAVGFGNLGVDVRYERGFTTSEFTFLDERIGDGVLQVDARPEQIIVAISVKI